MAYIGLWAGVYLYALGAGGWAWHSHHNVMAGVDRFLPLQLVASGIAAAVLLSGRQFHPHTWYRSAAKLPAAVTMAGVAISLTVLTLLTAIPQGPMPALPEKPAEASKPRANKDPTVVSL